MPVLVTAFGPFGGRKLNASSLALRLIKSTTPDIRIRILPVDSVRAPSLLKQAIIRTCPDALIMLGEAADSQTIRLETTAWNEKDFRIPDIAGRMPRNCPIYKQAGKSLLTTLPLQTIFQIITKTGIPVSLSNDPGRYLCNQLFFTALHFLQSKSIHIPAGFIHLPLETTLPTKQATIAISTAIKICEYK